jgi:hypothetical protein
MSHEYIVAVVAVEEIYLIEFDWSWLFWIRSLG